MESTCLQTDAACCLAIFALPFEEQHLLCGQRRTMRPGIFFCSQGVSALAQLVALTISGFCASASDYTFQPDTSTNTSPALQQALSILDQIRREQRLLQEAFDRLGARQDVSFEQQAKAVSEQRRELVSSLMLQRDQEMESLNAVGRTIITAACSVAGLLLFAMAGVAWSLVRVLQRISACVIQMPSVQVPFPHPGESGASALLQSRFAAAIEQLEKSLLSLEAAVVRIAPGQLVVGAARQGNPVRSGASLPPRTQFRAMPTTVVPMPAEALPGDFL